MRITIFTLIVTILISSCSKNDRVVRYEGYSSGEFNVIYTDKNGKEITSSENFEWSYEFDASKGDPVYLKGDPEPGFNSVVKLYVDNEFIDSSAYGEFINEDFIIQGFVDPPIEMILE